MTTKTELRQRIGEDLGLVPIGQDLESQDQARIDRTIDEVYARLQEKGLATWTSTGDIPLKLTPYFALMIEEKLLTSFSVPTERYQRIKAEAGPDGVLAQAKISELGFSEYISTTEPTDF